MSWPQIRKGFLPHFTTSVSCVKNRGHIFAYSYMCFMFSFHFSFYIFWATFNLNWNQMKILFSCLLRFYFQKYFNLAETEQVHRGHERVSITTKRWARTTGNMVLHLNLMVYSSYPPCPSILQGCQGWTISFYCQASSFLSPLSHHVAFRVLLSRPGHWAHSGENAES